MRTRTSPTPYTSYLVHSCRPAPSAQGCCRHAVAPWARVVSGHDTTVCPAPLSLDFFTQQFVKHVSGALVTGERLTVSSMNSSGGAQSGSHGAARQS